MRYAIGDIHGGCRTFRALLKQINLQQEDQLYLLGDYVDRGPDSKGVLDAILELLSAGYDVRPVRGNHDDMMLRASTGNHDEYSGLWLEFWGNEVLQSFGVDLIEDVPVRYVSLLKALPYIRYDDEYVFVHAGLDMSKADPIKQSSPECMIWSRTGSIDSARIGDRRLVTGHTINTIEQIRLSLENNHILLDNGAFTNRQPDLGNLVALNLDNRTLYIQPWLDGSVVY